MTNANEAIGVARGRRVGHAGRHLVHARDRRTPADRTEACGTRSKRSTRTAADAGLLHDQLRSPHAFRRRLVANEDWVKRLRGIRANASTRSHAELDQAKDLDDGDPADSAASTGSCGTAFPTSPCWVDAAAPTIVTSSRFALPAPRPAQACKPPSSRSISRCPHDEPRRKAGFPLRRGSNSAENGWIGS